MKFIDQISVYDLPTTKIVPDGYKDIPNASDENVAFLIDKYNELVDTVNQLIDMHTNK